MQSDESGLWKYLELPQVFQQKAGEIDITCKQHARVIERLAKYLSKQKPKTPEDFERVEYLKDFCIKSAQLNDQTITILAYLRDRLNELYADYKAFTEGAKLNAIIRDQGEKIREVMNERDKAQNELNELKRKFRAIHPATT